MNSNFSYSPNDGKFRKYTNSWQKMQPPASSQSIHQAAPPLTTCDSTLPPAPTLNETLNYQPRPLLSARYAPSRASPRYAVYDPYKVDGWSGITYVNPEDEVADDGTHLVAGKFDKDRPYSTSPRYGPPSFSPNQRFVWPSTMPPNPFPEPEKHDNVRRARAEPPLNSPGSVVPGFIMADNRKNERCKSKQGDPLGWFDMNMINQYIWAIVEWEDYDKIIIENGIAIKTGKLKKRGRGVLILDLKERPTLEGVHPEKLFEICARYGTGNIRWLPKPSFKEVKDLLKRNDAKLVFNGATGCTQKVWQLYITTMNDLEVRPLLTAEMLKS